MKKRTGEGKAETVIIKFDYDQWEDLLEKLDGMVERISAMVHGPVGILTSKEGREPTGLEALAIALAGWGLEHPLGTKLDEMIGILHHLSEIKEDEAEKKLVATGFYNVEPARRGRGKRRMVREDD